MDDGGKGKRVRGGLQMSIHLLYTESNNMGFTYQNPFFHFYWHSPTVYRKFYTRVDQFTSLNKTKQFTRTKISLKDIKEIKRKYTYKSALYCW